MKIAVLELCEVACGGARGRRAWRPHVGSIAGLIAGCVALLTAVVAFAGSASAADGPKDSFFQRSAWLKGNELHILGTRRLEQGGSVLLRRRSSLVDGGGPAVLEWVPREIERMVGGEPTVAEFPTRSRYDGKYVWFVEPRDTSSARILSPNFAAVRLNEYWFTVDGRHKNPPTGDWGTVVQGRGLEVRPDTLHGFGHSSEDVGDPQLKVLYDSFAYEMSIDERGYAAFGRAAPGAVGTEALPKLASYDILPIGPQKYRLVFVSEPVDRRRLLLPPTTERTAFILKYEFQAFQEKNWGPNWHGRLSLVERVGVNFTAPFRYVAAANRHYFILDDGRLFGTSASTPGAGRAAEEMRLRDGALIQAVIFDLDRGDAAFALTTKYWFELKQPLEYRDFELGSLADEQLPATLDQAAKEVRRRFPAVKTAVQAAR